MTTPTAVEQELLELVNRARLDPLGEFDQLILDAASGTGVTSEITDALAYFGVDLDLFLSQLTEYDPVAPLAWNRSLAAAATDHNLLMIEQDAQEHVLRGEDGLYDRIVAAGYDNATRVSENIYAYAYDAVYAHAGFYIDWGYGPGGMQDPAGHRINILNGSLTEVGIDAVTENDPATLVGPLLVTQDFGTRSDYVPMLLGVVIRDGDGDLFYDAGEGLEGVTVTATDATGNAVTTTSWSSGGYQMELAAGTYTVSFSGGGLDGVASYEVVMGRENTQLYGYAADAVAASVTVQTGGGGDDVLIGGEGLDSISGGAGDDSLEGGDDADTLDGGTGNDVLYGDAGDDRLDGGAGADLLVGGPGSDVIYVDDLEDRVGESRSWEGHDTVISSVDFRMGTGHIEDLELTGSARIGAGNGLMNRITGNDGDNILDGGKNNDTLVGGLGDDTYLIRSPGDTAVEAFGEGVDTVKAYRSYALEANVEKLFMQTVYTKDGDPTIFNGVGNGLDNTIVGTPFENFLIGREGRDTLKGQAGADSFVFDRDIGASNVDRIIDFNMNEADEGDILMMKGAVFGDLAAGALAADRFVAGSAAGDANDRFVFDRASGQLWFDADGSGAGDQVLIVTFEQNALVTADDIVIF